MSRESELNDWIAQLRNPHEKLKLIQAAAVCTTVAELADKLHLPTTKFATDQITDAVQQLDSVRRGVFAQNRVDLTEFTNLLESDNAFATIDGGLTYETAVLLAGHGLGFHPYEMRAMGHTFSTRTRKNSLDNFRRTHFQHIQPRANFSMQLSRLVRDLPQETIMCLRDEMTTRMGNILLSSVNGAIKIEDFTAKGETASRSAITGRVQKTLTKTSQLLSARN